MAYISDFLSSDLEPQTALAFEDHLAICGDCSAFLKTYKKTIDLTRAFLTSPTQADRSGTAFLPLR